LLFPTIKQVYTSSALLTHAGKHISQCYIYALLLCFSTYINM